MKRLIISILLMAMGAVAQVPKHCAGITKKGESCKSTFIIKGTDYCRAHSPGAIHCAHIKSDSTQCKMIVKTSGELCRFHASK